MLVNLQQLQQSLQNNILHGDQEIKQHIVGSSEAARENRLAVYADAYGYRLCDILLIDYPVLQKFMGEESFHKLCQAYVREQVASECSVSSYSANMQNYLLNNHPYNQQPWLAELADLEWAMEEATIAADAEILRADDLKDIATEQWPAMCFQVHPAVRLLSLQYNVVEIWQTSDAEQEQGQEMAQLQKEEGVKEWVVWRQGIKVVVNSYQQQAVWMLKSFQQNLNFAEVCQGLCHWFNEDEATRFAVESLHKFLHNSVLIDRKKCYNA